MTQHPVASQGKRSIWEICTLRVEYPRNLLDAQRTSVGGCVRRRSPSTGRADIPSYAERSDGWGICYATASFWRMKYALGETVALVRPVVSHLYQWVENLLAR